MNEERTGEYLWQVEHIRGHSSGTVMYVLFSYMYLKLGK